MGVQLGSRRPLRPLIYRQHIQRRRFGALHLLRAGRVLSAEGVERRWIETHHRDVWMAEGL